MSEEIARFSAEQTANFLGGGALGRPQYADPELQRKMDAHRRALRIAFNDCTDLLGEALHDLSPSTENRLRTLHQEAVDGNSDATRLYITLVAELASQALAP